MANNVYVQNELRAAQAENSELHREVQMLQRRLALSNDQADRRATLLDQARDEALALRRATDDTQKRSEAIKKVLDKMARELRTHR
jgi:hypothetical protein